jgi:cell division protein FtsB
MDWIKKSLVVFICVFAVLQYRLWFGDTGILATKEIENKTQKKLNQINNIQAENQSLRERAHFYKKYPQSLEGVARKALGYTRADEVFVKISPNSTFAKKTSQH